MWYSSREQVRFVLPLKENLFTLLLDFDFLGG
jgi:hypothetical protein